MTKSSASLPPSPETERARQRLLEARRLLDIGLQSSLEPAYLEPATPGLLCGEYELIRALGRERAGFAYAARHSGSGRHVTLKVIDGAELGIDTQALLLRVEALRGLGHPNLVPVLDSGEVDERVFIALQPVDGGSLERALPRLRASQGQVALLLIQVARALQHAHEHGVVHGNLTLSSIALDEHGSPRLGDFSIPVGFGDAALESSYAQHPETPPVRGACASLQLGIRRDLHALGSVLFELLTGGVPMHGLPGVPALSPRAVCSSVSRPLEAVCLAALASEPAQRYPSAAAFARDLERYLQGVRPVALGRNDRRGCRRRWYCASRGRGKALWGAILVASAATAVSAGSGRAEAITPSACAEHCSSRSCTGPSH